MCFGWSYSRFLRYFHKKDLDVIIELTLIEESSILLNLIMYAIMFFSIPEIRFVARIGYVVFLMFITNKLLI